MLPDDGDNTETCWSSFSINFNILLTQLFCVSVSNKTLIVSRCTIQKWKKILKIFEEFGAVKIHIVVFLSMTPGTW